MVYVRTKARNFILYIAFAGASAPAMGAWCARTDFASST
jgi:hypothetical protein